MAISATDVLRVTVKYLLPDLQTNQNVLYYLAGAGVSDTDQNVITAIEAQMNTSYAQLNTALDADIEPSEMVVAKYDPVTFLFEQIGTEVLVQPDGSGAGDPMPNTVAAVVRFFTDGLGQQGRKYISGLLESNASQNTLVGATVTILTNFGLDFHDAVAVAGGSMLPGWWDVANKVHRAYNGTVAVNTIVGTQVRRKPGRGSV